MDQSAYQSLASRPLPRERDRLARRGVTSLFWRRSAPIALFWALVMAILALPVAFFLVVAFSPRLLDQGPQWLTLQSFQEAYTGQLVRGLVDSVGIGSACAVIASGLGLGIAWLSLRTDMPGRRYWAIVMFALLFTPSYLIALGWERLLEPYGLLDTLGLHWIGLRKLFYGPFGVTVVLAVKGLPFAYLAISSALRGLGDEYEAAVRVHGGGAFDVARTVTSLLAPAMWSALAIVFAESVSDFGVAATLANDAHFPVATYTLFNAVEAFPTQFPVAAAVAWSLMLLAAGAIVAQSLALRSRSYRVLGGRTRPAHVHHLGVTSGAACLLALVAVAGAGIGVPALGAISASLIKGFGSLAVSHSLSLQTYQRVLSTAGLRSPLAFSSQLGTATATGTVILAAVCARVLTKGGGSRSARALDLILLTAVALPGIVFAAGYIFTYNLPVTNALGIHLYDTTWLLLAGYLATALPSTSRLLVGSVGQIQESLSEAARVHGFGPVAAWARGVLPLLSRPLVSTWVLTFALILLELPVSELLYPPGVPPVSVAITKALANYDFSGGMAMEVVAVLLALGVAAAAWGAYRLLAPEGWRRLGRAA